MVHHGKRRQVKSSARYNVTNGVAAWLLATTIAVAAQPALADGEAALSLGEAEQLALTDDPNLASLDERAGALEERAVADGALPDPKFRFGLANMPVNSFSFTQERMTQFQVGLTQAFPRGQTRSLQTRKTGALARIERAHREDQAGKTTLSVRQSWFELFYWRAAAAILEEEKQAFTNLIGVLESLYATGRHTQQDVLQAELELSLLEDRQIDIERQIENAVATLAKWVGQTAARRPLPNALPDLPAPTPLAELIDGLPEHPAIQVQDKRIDASRTDIALAEQAYSPEWGVGVSYGRRGGEDALGRGRPDFVSLMVTMDLPFFTAKRQDKRLAASKRTAAATQYQKQDALRELRRQADAQYAAWQRSSQRAQLYERTVTMKAARNLEASLSAYRSDVSDFSALMRAQIVDLETKLKALRIQIDRAKAQAQLLYLQGDVS